MPSVMISAKIASAIALTVSSVAAVILAETILIVVSSSVVFPAESVAIYFTLYTPRLSALTSEVSTSRVGLGSLSSLTSIFFL